MIIIKLDTNQYEDLIQLLEMGELIDPKFLKLKHEIDIEEDMTKSNSL